MAVPILTTKLYIPQPSSDLVARPRLLKLMTENAQRGAKLTLISAPPGFGKTTLVSQWILQNDQLAAWLSLDEGDNDPVRFLTYFIAALQTLHPKLGEGALTGLQSPKRPTLEALLVVLLNDVASISSSVTLVLDDYHLITTASIHQALTFLLERMPSRMHLIITGRTDPALPLARLRARQQMTELREADLRLTLDEAADFLNRMMGLSLLPEDVATLEARTEGWIAGLQLAALSMQGVTDLPGFIKSFSGSHRHIVDYLAQEVLYRQPEEVQTFLLRTSILERLCGPLCNALFEVGAEAQGSAEKVDAPPPASSQTILEQLESANLFLIPLDNERRWYRYHHLFADLLQVRLQQVQHPAQIVELHRRAAEWYEVNGLVDAAIHHAIKGDDPDRVGRLVTANAPAMLAQGQVVTLQGWLDALPQEIIYTQPPLCLGQAWLWLLRRRLQAIEPYLEAAEQALADADSDQQAAGQGEMAAIRAFTAYEQGRIAPAIDLARQALSLLPKDSLFARGSSALALGAALLAMGNTGPAVTALAESVTLGRAAGNAMGALYSLGTLIVALKMQGQLRRAEQVVQEAFDWAADRHWLQLPPAAALYIRLGDIRREQNDLTAAEKLLTQAVQVAQFGAPLMIARAQAFLARLKQTQGDAAAATALLQQVTQICQNWETGEEVAYFTAYRIQIVLRQGRLAEAAAWAEQLPAWTAAENSTYFREFELVILARVRLAQGLAQPDGPHLAEAQALLVWLRQQAEAARRTGIVIETLTLEALALAAQSKLSQAVSTLSQALTLAEPEGYLRLFLDEDKPLAALLAQLPPTPYRDKILAAFSAAEAQESRGAEEKYSSPTPPLPRSAALVEPLSDRELEVLRLMAGGYSNREIAETLVFTVATAKKHAENIYGKLGVHSRTQALARARELNLL